LQTRIASAGSGGLAVGAASALCALCLVANHRYFQDDTFITLRYARNWIEHGEISWNLGERVEGYSNFLHLVLIAGLGRLGMELVTAARFVSLTAYVTLVWWCDRQLRRRRSPILATLRSQPGSAPFGDDTTSGNVSANLVSIALLTSSPLILWSWGGLEGPLCTLFCTVGLWSTLASIQSKSEKHLTIGSLGFGFAVLTRLDAFVLYAVCMSYVFATAWDQGATQIAARRILSFALPFLALFVPFFAWRVWYYGAFWPNTFYAKVTGTGAYRWLTGAAYVLAFFSSPPWLLGVSTWLGIGVARKRQLTEAQRLLIACIGAQLAYVFAIGGDHMPGFRMLLPVLPSIALLFASLVGARPNMLPHRTYALVLSACAVQLLSPVSNQWTGDPAAVVGRAVGGYIDQHWPAGSLVALHTAGAVPYFAPQQRYIDMLGLNDAHIAHRAVPLRSTNQYMPGHTKGDGRYVLSRRPDYIIAGPAEGSSSPWFLSDVELFEDPRFAHEYVRRTANIDVHGIDHYTSYDALKSGTLTLTYYERVATVSGR
jgi:arabinofuranosyltransferase